VHAGMNGAGHAFGGKNGPERQSCGERFGNGYDIGLNAVVLICEMPPGAAQPALNFIQNQQRSGARRQLSRELQKLPADGTDSALALNCFQSDGADAAIELPLQVVNIVEANKADAGQQGREGSRYFA